jgi:hypothetical protein
VYDHVCFCAHILGLFSTYDRKFVAFVFLSLAYKSHGVMLPNDWVKLHYIDMSHFLDPFISCRASELFL